MCDYIFYRRHYGKEAARYLRILRAWVAGKCVHLYTRVVYIT